MKLTNIAIALIAASSLFAVNTSAMAFPNGPQDFQNKPQPKFPGPKNPQDFKLPPKKQGPNNGNNFNQAFGIMMGISAIAAAAAHAADDDTVCWKEKHKGKIVLICTE